MFRLSRSAAVALLATVALGGATMPAAVGADPPDVQIRHSYASGTAEGEAFATLLDRAARQLPDVTIWAEEVPFSDLFLPFDGGSPDLIVGPNDSLGNQVRDGSIADVSGLLTTRWATLRRQAKIGSIVDGTTYLVPFSLKAVALVYDRSRLPIPPRTTADWLRKADGGARLGIVAGGPRAYYAYGFYSAFGGRVLDDTGRCVADQNDGVADALAWIRDAAAHGIRLYDDAREAEADLVHGDLDGFIEGNWRFGDLRAALGSDLGVVPGPTGPAGLFRPLVGVDGYVVNVTSPDPEGSRAVALAMTDRRAQQRVADVAGHVPADRAVVVTDARVRTYARITTTGIPRPQSAEFNEYWGAFSWAFDAIVYGGEDPDMVVATACAAMNEANGF